MAEHFTAPEEVIEYLGDMLEFKAPEFGIASVMKYTSKAITDFPAVCIIPDPVTTNAINAGNRFQNFFTCSIYVYHARLTATRAQRTKEDLELVTLVRKYINSDKTLGGHIIQGWVNSQAPGVLERASGSPVVGTRMTWAGEARELF
jgi:hypothetical protein